MSFFLREFQYSTDSKQQERLVRSVWYAVTILLLIAAHQIVIPALSIAEVTPDLVLIALVVIAIVEGQMYGVVAAFLAGLIFDIATADILGVNGFAKLLATFGAGYAHNPNTTARVLGSWRFLVILALAALGHNVVYFFFYLRPTELSFTDFFLIYGLATTAYTVVLGLLPMLYFGRKKEY